MACLSWATAERLSERPGRLVLVRIWNLKLDWAELLFHLNLPIVKKKKKYWDWDL